MPFPDGSMIRWLPLLALAFSGCNQDENAAPPKIKGLWQVHQFKTSSGITDANEVTLARFPGCSWARQTWDFDDTTIRVEHDVLCPTPNREFVGCEVGTEVDAAWNDNDGQWVVGSTVSARSRAVGLEPGAFSLPTSCTVEIEAGSYLVKRMSREIWQWEMRLPSGVVLRLKIPESDDPDFVMAMRQATEAEGSP